MTHRQRYSVYGAERSGDADLVALILGAGSANHTPAQLAAELLARFGSLRGLCSAPLPALCALPGIGAARAMRLQAAIEVGRRSLMHPAPLGEVVRCPDSAYAHLAPMLQGRPFEALMALYLDRRHRVISIRELTRGSEALTIVDPRQVFRVGLSMSASSVVLAHNHPSGDPTPSDQDRHVTTRVARSGQVVGVRLLDHLVIGDGTYVSLAQQGVLPRWITPNELWTT